MYELNKKNIIHRDIKLENIQLISNDFEKKNMRLTGFGIAVLEENVN